MYFLLDTVKIEKFPERERERERERADDNSNLLTIVSESVEQDYSAHLSYYRNIAPFEPHLICRLLTISTQLKFCRLVELTNLHPMLNKICTCTIKIW